jgi:hypothetical protein
MKWVTMKVPDSFLLELPDMEDPTQAAEGIHKAIKWNSQVVVALELARLGKIARAAVAHGAPGALYAAVNFFGGLGRPLPEEIQAAVVLAIRSGRLDLLKPPPGEDAARSFEEAVVTTIGHHKKPGRKLDQSFYEEIAAEANAVFGAYLNLTPRIVKDRYFSEERQASDAGVQLADALGLNAHDPEVQFLIHRGMFGTVPLRERAAHKKRRKNSGKHAKFRNK